MKRAVTVTIPVAMLVMLAGCGSIERIEEITIEPVPFELVADGSYRGVERQFPVTAVVDVTVQDGRVDAVNVVRHLHGPEHGAEQT